MKVPFLQLARASREHGERLRAAMARVVERGWYVLGPELEAFEAEFAAACGARFAVGTASGTDAIQIALEASGAVTPGAGDEVVTPALSAAFTGLAIHRAGAVPRFADVSPDTLQIDPRAAAEAIGPRTRALLPVHLYGSTCDLTALEQIASRHGLALLEDACQAHGTRRAGRHAGTFGIAGCFSFYPTKNLGALGDGGLLVTGDSRLAERARMLRHGGQSRTYRHELLGVNSRLDELQAAVLRVKLELLEGRNDRRRALASRYEQELSGLRLRIVAVDPACEPNRHLFVVRLESEEERDRFRSFLADRGVQTLVHYPAPLPDQPALARFARPQERFPAASAAAREIVSLPLYPELSDPEHDHVIGSARAFFGA
jgi:dTDP-3-amino-3,4,6-trideoxy-alpha-D-glucose transaminase